MKAFTKIHSTLIGRKIKYYLTSSVILSLVFILSIAWLPASVSEVFAQSPWTQKADMQNIRQGHSSGVLDGLIYVMGGVQYNTSSTHYNALKSMEFYDPDLDIWTPKADMDTGRVQFPTCVIDGKIYAIGGGQSVYWDPLKTMEVYDPVSDTWTTLEAELPIARMGHTASLVNGKIYIIGGTDSNDMTPLAQVDVYDPLTNSWDSPKADLPTPRLNLLSVELNGLIYVLGGHRGPQDGELGLATVEAFDPATDTWSTKADMNIPRKYFAACVLNEKIYVFGGAKDCNNTWSSVEVYDPLTNTWEEENPFTNKWVMAAASPFNGKIFLSGGTFKSCPPSTISVMYEYNPHYKDEAVSIPDKAFLYALIEEGFDTDNDSLISYDEAEMIRNMDVSGEGWSDFIGQLHCDRMGEITSLKGIEAFINLDTLICHCNQINKLDLSSNIALSYLECGGNSLKSLNVSNNTALKSLKCGKNQIETLDLSKNDAIIYLGLMDMPTLDTVFVWEWYPSGVEVQSWDSDVVYKHCNTFKTYSFPEIRENLFRERLQTGDLEIRKLSLYCLDLVASYRYFNQEKTSEYWLDMFNKAIYEIQNEVVTEGATIWLIFNHGFVVKTPTVCFGFDLFDFFKTGKLVQLADLLDVLFISHKHKDHWSPELVDRMIKQGKPVVGPEELILGAAKVNYPMSEGDLANISGLSIIAHAGRHSAPVNQFEVVTPEGIKFLHTGDNNSISTMPDVEDLDVLMLNAWIEWQDNQIRPDRVKAAIDKVHPKVALPAHINELGHVCNGHTVPHWIDAYSVYNYELSFDYAILSWGERYHLNQNSNDTILPNDIENTQYHISQDSIYVTWDSPLSSEDGDTASFYRIILNNGMTDRILTKREFSFAWDSIGSSYSFYIYAYDDCGNQSIKPAEIQVTVPDLNYSPRIIGSSPGNRDTVQVFAGVSRAFQVIPYDPNEDTLSYTWKINDSVIPEKSFSEFIYNIQGLQEGVHKLTVSVSDLEFSTPFSWMLDHHNLIAIVDNDDTLMYSDSGNWITSFYDPKYYNANCRLSSIPNKGAWADFKYFPEIPGIYNVYTLASFRRPGGIFPLYCIIINDQPADTIILGQNPRNGAWIELGNYYFPDSSEVIIRAINTGLSSAGQTVFVDAIKFVHETVSGQKFKKRSTHTAIKLFPNPVNNILRIETGIAERYLIEISSLNGQKMFSTSMDGSTHQIDLSSFQSGVYFITIRSKDLVTTRKIVKL